MYADGNMQIMSLSSLAVLLQDRDTLVRLTSQPSRKLVTVKGSAAHGSHADDTTNLTAARTVVREYATSANAEGLTPLQFLAWARATGSLDCFVVVFDLVGGGERCSQRPSPQHPPSQLAAFKFRLRPRTLAEEGTVICKFFEIEKYTRGVVLDEFSTPPPPPPQTLSTR